MEISVAHYIINRLEQAGVEHIFGIPGVHNIELYRHLENSPIEHIVGRHEQALGFMADGYFRASGKLAVVFTITGPGLTNVVTALGQANNCSSKLLVIATTNNLDRLDGLNGDLHEIQDQAGITAHVAPHSYLIKDANTLPLLLERILASFEQDRPAPACLHIPKSLLGKMISVPATHPKAIESPIPSPAALEELGIALAHAKAPLIIAGGGSVNAAKAIESLAIHLDAPVVMTVNGRGVMDKDHELAVHASPSLKPVQQLFADSDLILALGTEWGHTDFDMYDQGVMPFSAKIYGINLSYSHLLRIPNLATALVGDVKSTLESLLPKLKELMPKPHAGNGAKRSANTRDSSLNGLDVRSKALIGFLEWMDHKAPSIPMVGDSTQVIYAGNLYFGRKSPKLWFNAATGFGALGFGLPAANGAAIALKQPVICITGDGGLQFTLAEIGTAFDLGLKLILIIWNNWGYYEIASAMKDVGIAPIGTKLTPPNFIKIAEAWNINAHKPKNLAEFDQAFCNAIEHNAPSLIELDENTALSWFQPKI